MPSSRHDNCAEVAINSSSRVANECFGSGGGTPLLVSLKSRRNCCIAALRLTPIAAAPRKAALHSQMQTHRREQNSTFQLGKSNGLRQSGPAGHFGRAYFRLWPISACRHFSVRWSAGMQLAGQVSGHANGWSSPCNSAKMPFLRAAT